MSSPASEKVLFVGTWGPPMVGGPKNLWNHLKKVPASRLVYLTCFHSLVWSKIDPACWLPGKYLFFDYKGEADRQAPRLEIDPRQIRYSAVDKISAYLMRLCQTLDLPRYRLGKLLIGALEQGAWVAKAFFATCSAVKNEKIEKIVVVSDMGWGMIGGYLAARWTGTPYLVYLFDLFADNHFTGANRSFARFFERGIFFYAKKIIVTNEETRRFYEAKYPSIASASIVYNSAEKTEEAHEPDAEAPGSRLPFSIVFAGRIYWAHLEAIYAAIDAIGSLASEGFALQILSPNQDPELLLRVAKHSNVNISFVDQPHVFDCLKKADLLLLPFSWQTPAPEIIRTASPAKLGEYLCAERPIWVLAPESSFVSRFVAEHHLGVISNRPEDIVAILREVRLLYAGKIAGWQENLRQCYQDYFSVEENAKALEKIVWNPT